MAAGGKCRKSNNIETLENWINIYMYSSHNTQHPTSVTISNYVK